LTLQKMAVHCVDGVQLKNERIRLQSME